MADWAQLAPDLLQSIASHLPHLSDHLRFRAVCSSFRSAAKSLPFLPPWIHIPPSSTFLSVLESKSYSLPPYIVSGANPRLFPFSDGWIALLHPPPPSSGLRPISLSLPLSRSSIPLPPLPLPCRILRSPESFRLTKFTHKGTPFVAALCPDGPGLSFCDATANAVNPIWRSIDTSSCFPQGDFAYHKGRFFVINRKTGVTSGFELDSGEKVVEVEGVGGGGDGGRVGDFYLVEWAMKGELLLVLKGELNDGSMFELFRLEEEGEEVVKWVGIDRLEDGVLFLDGLHGMCFTASWCRGCRENSVYFVDYIGGNGIDDCGVRLYDIGANQVEEVSSSFLGYCSTAWRRALWVVPNLQGR